MVFKVIGLVFCGLGMISAILSHGKPLEGTRNAYLDGAQIILLAIILLLL